MEDITAKLVSLNISKEKVLYYSVAFHNYKDIMNLVRNTLLVTGNNMSEIYTKTPDSFELFGEKLSDDNKMLISDKYSTHIEKLKDGENFIIHDNKLYTANPEFHITTLFTSGKPHDKTPELEDQVGKPVSIKLNKLAVSNNFIVLGVDTIKFEDDKDIAYYGNSVKHITIALNKTGKKVFPKDSYTALSDGQIYKLDVIVKGVCSKVVQ
jgi:hypothetical protein